MFVLLDLRDTGASEVLCTSKDMPDLVYVPESRLRTLKYELDGLKSLMEHHSLSEVRRTDQSIIMFDAAQIPADRDDILEAAERATNYGSYALCLGDWEAPNDSPKVDTYELKVLGSLFCWTALAREVDIESAAIDWNEWKEILSVLK